MGFRRKRESCLASRSGVLHFNRALLAASLILSFSFFAAADMSSFSLFPSSVWTTFFEANAVNSGASGRDAIFDCSHVEKTCVE